MQAGRPGEAAAVRLPGGVRARSGAGGLVTEAGDRHRVPQVRSDGREPGVDRGVLRVETQRGRGLPDVERAAVGCLLDTGAGVEGGEERLR